MYIEEEVENQENIRQFYDDFVKKTCQKLNNEKSASFSAEIEQKLKSVNVFQRNEKQNELIIREQRNKVIKEMEIHVEKCPYKHCKLVFEQVMIYGIFAGNYKQDPLSFIGYKVYTTFYKTDCPYGTTLNENMMQTHRILKEQLYKESKLKVI